MMAGRSWRPEETAKALACRTVADHKRVARETGRTAFAVADRRYLLEPVGVDRWKAEEDALLATLPSDRRARKGEVQAVAESLPWRSLKAIDHRRRLLKSR